MERGERGAASVVGRRLLRGFRRGDRKGQRIPQHGLFEEQPQSGFKIEAGAFQDVGGRLDEFGVEAGELG